MTSGRLTSVMLVAGLAAGSWLLRTGVDAADGAKPAPAQAGAKQIPYFEYDETFPKPLPNNWTLGTVVGIATEAKTDHIWLVHRGGTIRPDELNAQHNPPLGECCVKAPPVIELDYAGNVIQGWGGPAPEYDWPTDGAPSPDPTGGGGPSGMHSVYVDSKDFVWITATGGQDGQMLKFTRKGKFVLQIGKTGVGKPDSNNPDTMNKASGVKVSDGEVFVSDGYGNRRVVVYDAETGKYKRHWGAYGKRPDDSKPFKYDPNKPADQFSTPHGIEVSRDGLVYVADRNASRIQVFKLDGTYVAERMIEPQTLNGSVFGVGLSPEPGQRWVYIPDGRNERVWILERKTLEIVGSFGCSGHAGGCMTTPHSIDVDKRGNIYIGETWEGKRVQRYLYKGLRTRS